MTYDKFLQLNFMDDEDGNADKSFGERKIIGIHFFQESLIASTSFFLEILATTDRRSDTKMAWQIYTRAHAGPEDV